eukprot:355524-Chlamydomonas_euryale.AAC.52
MVGGGEGEGDDRSGLRRRVVFREVMGAKEWALGGQQQLLTATATCLHMHMTHFKTGWANKIC